MKSLQKQYWSFYWPLALTGVVLVLARQFQIGVISRYPDASRELATITYAQCTFFVFISSMVFVPQMSNVFARSRHGHRVCIRFTFFAFAVLGMGLGLLAYTLPGNMLLGYIYDIEGTTLEAVTRYLRYMTPLVVIHGLRQYHIGLLVQIKRTMLMTILNAIYLTTVIVMLLVGFSLGWKSVETVALAQIIAAVLHLCLVFSANVMFYHQPEKLEHEHLTYREVLVFFVPVVTTSIVMSFTRLVLYSFVSRVANSDDTVSALRVAIDFMMVFQMALNTFSHFFVTFGREDPEGTKIFLRRITLLISGVMVVIAVSPISTWIFSSLVGIKGDVLTMVRQILLVYCLIPPIFALRNYIHGSLLAHRRTKNMAICAVFHITGIFVGSWLFLELGWMTNIGAACIQVIGLTAETGMLLVMYLRRTDDEVGKPEEVSDDLE